MKVSKNPVRFANRAEMIDCVETAFSVGAHIPERVVMLNLYAADGSRVVEMTPSEAEEIARYLLDSARDVRAASQEARHAAHQSARDAAKAWQDVQPAKTADEDFTREVLARQSRERTQSGE